MQIELYAIRGKNNIDFDGLSGFDIGMQTKWNYDRRIDENKGYIKLYYKDGARLILNVKDKCLNNIISKEWRQTIGSLDGGYFLEVNPEDICDEFKDEINRLISFCEDETSYNPYFNSVEKEKSPETT